MPLHTTTTIRIEGHPDLAQTFASLEIHEQIDGHHTFSLTLPGQKFGAGAGTGKWRGLMGKRITIEIAPLDDPARGRNQSVPKLFTGLIMGLQLSKAYGPTGHVVLTGGSPTLLLDDDPHTQSFSGASLQRIVKGELGNYPGNLLRPQIDPATGESQDYVVQYKESTWAFLRRLARTHGEWFYYNGENVVFGRRNPETFTLTHDLNLDDFSLQMGMGPAHMALSGYDYSGDEVVNYDTNVPTGLNTYSQSAVDAGKSLFLRKGLATPNRRFNGSASQQMKAMAKRREDAAVAGMVHMRGESHQPRLVVGDHISVQESVSGKEAYGTYMLTEVRHQCISEGNYSNHFSAIPADAATPPHYLDDHPVAESQSAVVVDNNDPEDLGRVQVQFRWQEYGRTPWLRTVTPAGGADKGLYMIPEKGEEVMVDFEGGNPERPYVLGGAWNGGGPSGFGTPKNDVKAIKTRSGHTIELNDTSGGEFITIKDKNGNAIQMDTKNKSITINAPEDMTLNAKNMSINVEENLDVSVGKNKTENITEDWLISAHNEDKRISKEVKIISSSFKQEAQEIQTDVSGEVTTNAGGKISIASAEGIDYGE
jgi:uncharacterized protein involved in type VI secretion and phage assembly